jgi:hypothetical protein
VDLLFRRRVSPAEFAHQLLSSNLDWYWYSERLQPDADVPDSSDLPDIRPWTQLRADNVGLLTAEIQVWGKSDEGRNVVILGVDPSAVTMPVDEAQIRAALRSFATREEGPVRIVLIQIGDQPQEFLFIPRKSVGPVNSLLETWGIRPDIVRRDSDLAHLEAYYTLPHEHGASGCGAFLRRLATRLFARPPQS